MCIGLVGSSFACLPGESNSVSGSGSMVSLSDVLIVTPKVSRFIQILTSGLTSVFDPYIDLSNATAKVNQKMTTFIVDL